MIYRIHASIEISLSVDSGESLTVERTGIIRLYSENGVDVLSEHFGVEVIVLV